MKTLRCRELGFNCAHVIQAESEDEVVAQAAQHAAEVHHFTVTDEVEGQVRRLVHDTSDGALEK